MIFFLVLLGFGISILMAFAGYILQTPNQVLEWTETQTVTVKTAPGEAF